jgi:hypothetical protein
MNCSSRNSTQPVAHDSAMKRAQQKSAGFTRITQQRVILSGVEGSREDRLQLRYAIESLASAANIFGAALQPRLRSE